MIEDKRVGTVSVAKDTYSCGVGRIVIPYKADREQFIKTCFSTGLVSIQPEVNNPIHRCRIDVNTLQSINFPLNSSELGSYVAYLNIPKHKHPVIIACIDSMFEYGSLKENQFKLQKRTDFGNVVLLGDGNGSLTISVESDKNEKGRIDINLSNPNNSAQFNLNIKGTASVNATGLVNVSSDTEIKFESSTLNGESTYTSIKSDGTQEIGGSDDNMVRYSKLKEEYDKTKEVLDTILQILTGSPINEAGNGAPSSLQAALSAALTGKSTGDISSSKIDEIKTL